MGTILPRAGRKARNFEYVSGWHSPLAADHQLSYFLPMREKKSPLKIVA
jgi:hypothetical protein